MKKEIDEKQSVYFYLLDQDEEGSFFEARRREHKSVNSLLPHPNRDRIYLEPQRNRKQLGEFRHEIFSQQLEAYFLGSNELYSFFDIEVDIDFKFASHISSEIKIGQTQWKNGDLVVIVVRGGKNLWYARQYKYDDSLKY